MPTRPTLLPTLERRRDDYALSTDRSRLDANVIYGYLERSYWASERSKEAVAQSIANSIPIGLYHGASQVGFARVVTDFVVLAYLADVFVLEAHRGKGLGRWLVLGATELPQLATIQRWLLGTRDAHGLYAGLGFTAPRGNVLMERLQAHSAKAR